MATATPAKTDAKPAKKPPVAVATRIKDQLKRAAVGSKVTSEELDVISKLATDLKAFVS